MEVKNDIVKIPKENITVTANLIAFGTGGSILYQSKEVYESQKYDIFNKTQRIDSDFDKEVRGLLNNE